MDKRKNTILLYGVASNKPFCFFVKAGRLVLQAEEREGDGEGAGCMSILDCQRTASYSLVFLQVLVSKRFKGRTEILQKAVKSDDQERKCFGDIGMDDKISPGYLKKEQNQDIVYEGIMKKAL